jgi:MoaA/NifB/PqqE/SkfB family radical SAM enzyme
MRLEDIGFYTLSDARAKRACVSSPMVRGELILTPRCNFRCTYCRHVGQEMDVEAVSNVIRMWSSQGLQAIRFSGGEPTLYPGIVNLVEHARRSGIQHVALSTNGSARQSVYDGLLYAGANDFSVSLDACCAAGCETMAGVSGVFKTVVENIRYLAAYTYVTVGIVLTNENVAQVVETIEFAHSLGVADIRVIPAAQEDRGLKLDVKPEILAVHPILRYRVERFNAGKRVRGLDGSCAAYCGLCIDDSVVTGDHHYPCVIYLREGGAPIGRISDVLSMRDERARWSQTHNVLTDPICSKNCLDVCAEYNRRYQAACWRSTGGLATRKPQANTG